MRIASRIDLAVERAESGDAAGLLDMASSDFRAGSADRSQTRKLLFWAFRRYRNRRVLRPRPEIEIASDEQSARVRFPFLLVPASRSDGGMADGDSEGWIQSLADRTDLFRIHVDLRLDDGEWKFTQARLERFRGAGFQEVPIHSHGPL
ncbi:MAG: hypothetical protein JXR96_23475 [Deltaproteobacteria bacterium]|nr:hypothetical protein [Deltaproteobacteria bacterium]